MSTKKDLLEKLAEKLPYLSTEDAYLAVDSVIEHLKDGLVGENRIEVRGFGSFSIRKKKYVGQGRQYNTVYFRMSKNVKDNLNQVETEPGCSE